MASLPPAVIPAMPGNVNIKVPSALRVDESPSRSAASLVGNNDAQVVGTVISGGGQYSGIYAQHTAYSPNAFGLTYPAGASGTQAVFAPLTQPSNGGCLVSSTAAVKNSAADPTYTFFVVFDYCGPNGPRLVAGAQIDDSRDTAHVFKSNYMVTNGHGLPVYATLSFTTDAVPTQNSTWYLLLFNFASNNWNVVAQTKGMTAMRYGFSVYESTFVPGACPLGLPPIGADYLMLYNGTTGKFENVAPTMSGTTSVTVGPSSATPCFVADASGPAADAFAAGSGGNSWTVTNAVSATTFTTFTFL